MSSVILLADSENALNMPLIWQRRGTFIRREKKFLKIKQNKTKAASEFIRAVPGGSVIDCDRSTPCWRPPLSYHEPLGDAVGGIDLGLPVCSSPLSWQQQ